MALWVWRPHIFGAKLKDDEHVAIIQEVVPAAAAVKHLKSSGLAWRIGNIKPQADTSPWQDIDAG
jgi:hypothetical protein